MKKTCLGLLLCLIPAAIAAQEPRFGTEVKVTYKKHPYGTMFWSTDDYIQIFALVTEGTPATPLSAQAARAIAAQALKAVGAACTLGTPRKDRYNMAGGAEVPYSC